MEIEQIREPTPRPPQNKFNNSCNSPMIKRYRSSTGHLNVANIELIKELLK